MRANELLHVTFQNASNSIDKRISKALYSCVDSVFNGAHLSIASLGRHLNGSAQTKNKIKRVDRLLSNSSLQSHFSLFYQDMTKLLLTQGKQPIILVDGSVLSACGQYQFMSASVPLGGRSLPILEQSFLREKIMKPHSHKGFLERLKMVLPDDCKPIIVTDAAFKNPWFCQVKSMGWDYVGRSTSSVLYLADGEKNWQPIRALYSKAISKAEFVTTTTVSKGNPMSHSIYRYKALAKGRIKKNAHGKRSQATPDKKQANRAKQPWVLFSSLPIEQFQPKDIINIYKKRMQIEESFRDLKDDHHGLGLIYNRSRSINKITVALLIGAIVRFLLWALGLAAKKRNYHLSYQANTIRTRNVLSVFYIAKQFIRNHKTYHKILDPWAIIDLDILSKTVEYV